MSERDRSAGVVAVESRISAIVDETLTYRGIAIDALFAHASFEETVFLLWFGQLPTQHDLDAFAQRISATPALDDVTRDFVRRAAAGGVTRTLEAGIVGVGLMAPPDADLLTVSLLVLTGIPAIVAAYARPDEAPVPLGHDSAGSISERFLTDWRGAAPTPDESRAFDRALVLTADHELNASTFAARVAASTGADLISVVLAAIATQSGPLHGGSMVNAGRLLADALERNPAPEIDRRLAAGERLPGFGHSVYRRGDPRALLFRELMAEQAELTGDRQWLDVADGIAQIGTERIGLAPNLDLYAAAFWSALGIPPELFPAIFAIGRSAGWIAHYREQTADNRLIRPRARYIGVRSSAWVPIEQRGEWFAR